MELHLQQDQVASDLHRFRVLNCGRRFGKTTLAVEEIKGVAIAKPSKIAYIATTYAQARDIAWEMMKKEFSGSILKKNESQLEFRIRTQDKGESVVYLKGWENIETLRGQQFDFIVLDEVASMKNFWVNWHEVIRPTLTDTKGEALFISTPQGFNHFYDLCNLELKDTDYKTFHFSTYDNPYIPVEEIEKAKQELPKDRFLQEYMASFQKTSGLVYKEFDRSRHLYETLPPGTYEQIGGVDPGYVHPAAVLDIRIDQHGTWFVEDEWSKTGKTDAQIAEYVASMFGSNPVYPDPENQGFIKELIDRGVNVREVIKGKNSVVSGIQKVREMLINGRLKVNRKCVNTISGFEIYSYDENTDKENPIKENDDEMDALRYPVLMKENNRLSEQQNRRFEEMTSRLRYQSSE